VSAHRLKEQACPGCHRPLTGAANVDGCDGAPVAGDVTVCIYCTMLLVYDAQLSLRELDELELGALASDTRAALLEARARILELQRRTPS